MDGISCALKFSQGEKITPELANKIGVELAKKLYPEYQCIITTHVDRLHIHNHIIFLILYLMKQERNIIDVQKIQWNLEENLMHCLSNII